MTSCKTLPLVHSSDKILMYVKSFVYCKQQTYMEENLHGFRGFVMRLKVFPTNFISAILSADIYSKSCFYAYQKQNHKSFSYITIKSNEPRNFSPA